MRDREETFIFGSKEIFQQDIIDRRIDFLVDKVNSLEQKVNKISEMLAEISKKLGPSETILEVRSNKPYGFEPEEKFD
jgi:uncharacterized protein YydD (DUF2326 family)